MLSGQILTAALLRSAPSILSSLFNRFNADSVRNLTLPRNC